MKYILIIFIFSFTLYSCHKQVPVVTARADNFPASNYPFAVGDKWTYQVTEEVYGYIDTVTFEIISKTVSGSDTLYKTVSSSKGKIVDSTVVIKNFYGITYIPAVPLNSLFDSLWIIFPISDTPVFSSIKSDTPVTVGSNISTNILGTDYKNLIEIKRELIDSPYASVNLLTICPNVGIVSESLYVNYGNSVKTENVLLINYEIH